ncbi:abasic site processing protein YoqW-like isoform X2 [Hibiscus syriacus]|uniref:abasic site processing protein YoqW-like isoform X2 n=1 Tax=Hibiscus syriacus TaxID=106335 RepID=UPI00192310EF|nr:abasic site processing protein YoqW-like isoform X2 [Hibiscus syriacus]
MCGRARCTLRADDIPRACHRNNDPVRHVNMDRYRPSYNVGPGMNLPVVRQDDGSNTDGACVVLHCMKWGLVPSFTKKTDKPDFFKMFNARSESVSEKASFRRLLPKSRCVVAVEGFFEWKKDGSRKQPYYIHFEDGRPLVFAALYDSWENSEDRMPVILGDKGSTDSWLNGFKIDTLLKPYENPDLVWYPVTPAIGKLSFEGPECVKEVPLKTQENNLISNFFSTREVKKEQESNMDWSLCNESVEANLLNNLKKEPKSTEDELPSSTDEGNHDSKSNVPTLSFGDVGKIQTKRDYEEFSADTKPSKEEIEVSPARKKGNIKSGGDKQPTLFSYFGKK